MDKTLHYLLMADHMSLQRLLMNSIKDTGLTPGQPKVLDYLYFHNGVMQKEIAQNCHIEQATLTSVLGGMESKGLIERRILNGNRRSLYVFMTDKGRELAQEVEDRFGETERSAFKGFDEREAELLLGLLKRVNNNLGNIMEEKK